MKGFRLLFGAAALAIFAVVAVPVFITTDNEPETFETLPARTPAAEAEGWIRVNVELKLPSDKSAGADREAAIRAAQQGFLDSLARDKSAEGAFVPVRTFDGTAAIAGWLREDQAARVVLNPAVDRVEDDPLEAPALAETRALIGADKAEAAGVSGAGGAACVIDSGIDASVPELAGRIAATYCFCDDNPVPGFGCCDGGAEEGVGAAEPAGMDHGTSVAAIVASGHVQERGVAPGGKIVAVKVFGPSGYAYRSDVQKALEFCDANRALYDIKVVNLSLGSGKYASDCPSDSRTPAVASLLAHGVSVVAASGNDGYMDGVNAPACIPGIVSVGAVYDALIGPVTWCFNSSCTSKCKDSVANVDGVNCYSNAGPNLDLLAPGYASTVVRKGGAYRNMGGTSAAAPHVAGAMLALAQARPEWTPAERLQALQTTGKSVMDLRAGLAFPRVDLYAALGLEDADGDGVKAPQDNCPLVFNADQADSDADGRGDLCDNCPMTPNFGQEDVNGNAVGDACENFSPSCLPPAEAADAAYAAGPREAGFPWDLFGLGLVVAAVMLRRLRVRS